MGSPDSCSVETLQAIRVPPLSANNVHLYFISVSSNGIRQIFTELWSWSTPEEQARYHRYRFAQDRYMFLVGRGFLRFLIGHYAGWSPSRIVFRENFYGKPVVDELPDLSFNVSHCHDLVCVAMSSNFEVGVDVELTLPQRADLDIAEQYFTAAECAYIRSHSKHERYEAFFQLWTLKEAFIKCLGMGLSIPLDSFQFRLSKSEITVDCASDVLRFMGEQRWQFRSWRAWRYSVGLALRTSMGHLNVAEISAYQVGSDLSATPCMDTLAAKFRE